MILAQETRTLIGEHLDPIAVQALATRLVGELVGPGHPEYDAVRKTHDTSVDRYPALVVRAGDAADVIRAVEFAREHELTLAVRSGGHSVAGHGSVDDGLVVDLSRMKAVAVDPERRTVWAQPGATTADVCAQAQPYGLALSTGDTSTVGLGGLALGGGIGWLVRKYGLTIDSLLSVELVTADGRLIVASTDENPDLFWALRGGGGNFGIVTGFEFRLSSVGMILGGALALPATPEVLRAYVDYASEAPDELTTIAQLMPLPPLPIVPAEHVGALALTVMICYTGDLDEGQRVIDPLRRLAEPLAEAVGPMPYPALYGLTEMAAAPHTANVRSGFMGWLSDEAIEKILEHCRARMNPFGIVQIRPLGGAMARVPSEATAFAHRDKSIFLAIIDVIMGPKDEATDWTEALWRQVRPYTSGVYVNFLESEGEARIHEAYPTATYARLAEVKAKYDPTNLFRLNQNIAPAPTARTAN